MKYVIVYWSRYGNGKKLVTTLNEKLKTQGNTTELMSTDDANPSNLPDADYYIFSAPAEAFSLQKNMRTFMKKLDGMQGKKYGIINTHGMKRNWLGKMEKLLDKKQMVKVAAVDFQVGKDANSGDALPDGWETHIDNFAQQLN